MRIGIVGFGNFGQFLARSFVKDGSNTVYATSRRDYTAAARNIGVRFYDTIESMIHAARRDMNNGQGQDQYDSKDADASGLDCLILAPSILAFDSVVQAIVNSSVVKYLHDLLVVDVLSVKLHAKNTLLRYLPKTADILCTHPMFGPESGKHGWNGLPFVYEIIRVTPPTQWRMMEFLALFESRGCRMEPMTCEAHDEVAAGTQFITHFVGRVLSRLSLKQTNINTKGYDSLLQLVDNTCKDSFDLFLALYKHNERSTEQLLRFSKAFHGLARELKAAASSSKDLSSSSSLLRFNRLIEDMPASETVRLHALTQDMVAAGEVVTALNVGEPDFPPPEEVLKAANVALITGHTRYVSVQGDLDLREAICASMERRKGLIYSKQEILVANGGKQAIYEAIQVLCEEGDEVLVPTPYWVSHSEIPRLAGAVVVSIPTLLEDNFCLQPDDLRSHLSAATRVLILCNPGNPTGSVYSRTNLEALAEVLREPEYAHVWILADEIYEMIVYDGLESVSFATLEGMRNRTVTVNGFSKAYSMTGFRVGWLAAPSPLVRLATKLQGQITSCAGSISQRAALAALSVPQNILDGYVTTTQEKRDYCYSRLTQEMKLMCTLPQGAFYLFPCIKKYFGCVVYIPNLSDTTQSDDVPQDRVLCSTSFCELLLKYTKLSLVPGSAFGANHYIRISYATSMKELRAGMDKLQYFLNSLKTNT